MGDAQPRTPAPADPPPTARLLEVSDPATKVIEVSGYTGYTVSRDHTNALLSVDVDNDATQARYLHARMCHVCSAAHAQQSAAGVRAAGRAGARPPAVYVPAEDLVGWVPDPALRLRRPERPVRPAREPAAVRDPWAGSRADWRPSRDIGVPFRHYTDDRRYIQQYRFEHTYRENLPYPYDHADLAKLRVISDHISNLKQTISRTQRGRLKQPELPAEEPGTPRTEVCDARDTAAEQEEVTTAREKKSKRAKSESNLLDLAEKYKLSADAIRLSLSHSGDRSAREVSIPSVRPRATSAASVKETITSRASGTVNLTPKPHQPPSTAKLKKRTPANGQTVTPGMGFFSGKYFQTEPTVKRIQPQPMERPSELQAVSLGPSGRHANGVRTMDMLSHVSQLDKQDHCTDNQQEHHKPPPDDNEEFAAFVNKKRAHKSVLTLPRVNTWHPSSFKGEPDRVPSGVTSHRPPLDPGEVYQWEAAPYVPAELPPTRVSVRHLRDAERGRGAVRLQVHEGHVKAKVTANSLYIRNESDVTNPSSRHESFTERRSKTRTHRMWFDTNGRAYVSLATRYDPVKK